MPRGKPLVDLDFIDGLGNKGDMVGTGDLGHRNGVHRGADAVFEVAHGQPPGTIDAHQHVQAVAGHGGRRAGDRRPGAGQWHTVLEVENDRIGAPGMCLGDEFLDMGRHE